MLSIDKGKSFQSLKLLVIVTVVAWCWCSPVQASLVTYQLSGTLSGTLGSFDAQGPNQVNFTNAGFQLSAGGDSQSAYTGPNGVISNPVTYSLFISGVGTLGFYDGGWVITGGFGPPSVDFYMTDTPNTLGGVSSPLLSNWNDVSSIGPVFGGGYGPIVSIDSSGDINQFAAYYTTGGWLYVSGSNESSFVVNGVGGTTPEPSLFVVVGLGVGVLLGTAYRRKLRQIE